MNTRRTALTAATASLTLLGDHVIRTSLPERERFEASVPVPPHAALPPQPASGTNAAGNVVPITRARRTWQEQVRR